MRHITNDFASIFAGQEKNFGKHKYGKISPGAKEVGGASRTVTNTLLGVKDYSDHLEGNEGLGIVPINERNEVKFCVIDVDIYDNKEGVERVIRAIDDNSMPISIFRSKSSGYHLYLFFNEHTSAGAAIKIAQRFIRLLAIDKLCDRPVEIFPKQSTLNKGQVGNWINLPYYNSKNEPYRQCMVLDGKDITLEEALIEIKDVKRHSAKEFDIFLNSLHHSEAPPCLQTLYYLNDVLHNRNNFLFSFGVYLSQKNEDTYQQELYLINKRLPNPLPDNELENTVLKSVRSKSYSYKCKEDPCSVFCARTECKKRKYGIGEGGFISNLDFGQMKQLRSGSDYVEYLWKLNDKEVRFKTEEDILNQSRFRSLCMRKLLMTPQKVKDDVWTRIVNSALAEIEVIDLETGDMLTPLGQFKSYVGEFLLHRVFATNTWQVKSGRVYLDKEKGVYVFNIQSLRQFLTHEKNFKEFTQQDIRHYLDKELKATPVRLRDKNGGQFRAMGIFEDIAASLEVVQYEDEEEYEFTPEDIEFEKY